MRQSTKVINDQALLEHALQLLTQRGVTIADIAEIVYDLQIKYVPNLTHEECVTHIESVLKKREVLNAIITGIEFDMAAENNQLSPILTDMLMRDEGLYGIDEVLVLSIVNVYGSIGFTNFGYVDKLKPGIIGKLNDEKGKQCNTFIDDIVGAIAAVAASRIAHAQPEKNIRPNAN